MSFDGIHSEAAGNGLDSCGFLSFKGNCFSELSYSVQNCYGVHAAASFLGVFLKA